MFEVREKPKMVQRALLVGALFPHDAHHEEELLLAELTELVSNLGISVVAREIVPLREPRSRFLLGSGRAEQVIEKARELECDCIVFDDELTPAQQRNWEAASELCVIDRQEVILDIFAERAQTREAVLQVELARMEYNLPRLKRAWTHLSRQRGGGVTQRGEGEAQLQLDQRMVRDRIAKLRRELESVVRHRQTQRKQRMRVPVPTAAIVGYTNAGKSSLLNRLTEAGVLAEDKLFATLDPTTRRLTLPGGQVVLLTDTVGFVRRLPHRLVEAFKATLEEAIVSNFLIHVLDASSPEVENHHATTLEVLEELGAERKRIITVYNKMDLTDEVTRERIEMRAGGAVCPISAVTGEGVGRLLEELEEMLRPGVELLELKVPHDRYDLIHRLHEAGAVKHEEAKADGVRIVGNVPHRLVAEVREFVVEGNTRPEPASPVGSQWAGG